MARTTGGFQGSDLLFLGSDRVGSGGKQGAIQGAAAGLPFAASTMGLSVVAGAFLGGSGVLGGGRGAVEQIDVNSELARIRQLFEVERQSAIRSIQLASQRQRRATASNLAARGILRSAVSENVFGEGRRQETEAIAAAEGQLAGQQARVEADLIARLRGINLAARQQAAQLAAQRQATTIGALVSVGTALARNRPAGTTEDPTAAASGQSPSSTLAAMPAPALNPAADPGASPIREAFNLASFRPVDPLADSFIRPLQSQRSFLPAGQRPVFGGGRENTRASSRRRSEQFGNFPF